MLKKNRDKLFMQKKIQYNFMEAIKIEKTKRNYFNIRNLLFILYILGSQLNLLTSVKSYASLNDLQLFRSQMQGKVKKISDALVKVYQSNCTQQMLNCTTKSYDFCLGTGPRTCISNFPTPSGCLFPGITLSLNSAIRIPNIFSKDNLNNNLRQFICATALIENQFVQIQNQNKIKYSYAYIGSSGGALRVYPTFKQQKNPATNSCINFDPRKRPWYVSAITGSKTTIILLDISKTMVSLHPGLRFFNSKVTLEIVFETLNSFDKVGVVVFSKTARKIVFQIVVDATEANKDKIMAQIKNLNAEEGFTNYTDAFTLGMSMLVNVQMQCNEIVFLLLTDGYTEDDQQKQDINVLDSLIKKKLLTINKKVSDIKIISFVYGVQDNINYTIVRTLTCLYNGIVFRMWDGIQLFQMIQKLTSYYIFLSEGMDPKLIEPLWSEPYQDAFGFGTILSITIPVYVPSRKVNKIIGVAAIDVLLSQFQKYGFSQSQIVQYLKHQPQCFNSSLQKSEMIYLRCKQGNITCNQSCSASSNLSIQQLCSEKISNDVFYDSVQDGSDDVERCCGVTIKQFLIILFSSVSLALVVAITTYLYKSGKLGYLYHKCKQSNNNSQKQLTQSKMDSQTDRLLSDPLEKYKEAYMKGIKIYYEPKFRF